MATQTANKDIDLLYEIQKLALDYGVRRIVKYPKDNYIEITYRQTGHGSALSDKIADKMQELAPDRNYRIKMTPSDLKLIVQLL